MDNSYSIVPSYPSSERKWTFVSIMTLGSEYRLNVLQSFQKLQDSLAALEDAVCQQDAHLPVWFQPPQNLQLPNQLSDREKAIGLIQQLEYLDHQAPREILVGAGLLAASPRTLEVIHQLNLNKDLFKSSILSLRAAKIPVKDPYLTENFEKILNKRSVLLNKTLKKMGLSRLHLKQCYRRLPFFKTKPYKVSWTWANTRAISRISVKEAETLLRKHGQDPGIEWQLAKLQTLGANEPLAIVQELAPHLRANVLISESDSEYKRMMVKGPVPLFYPMEDDFSLPIIRPPGEKRGRNKNRLIRSDVKLEPTPFLPAIRVHRYL